MAAPSDLARARERSRAHATPPQAEHVITSLRGERVILDADLARLYGVETKRLNEQVRRNLARFPSDFVFQLSAAEAAALRSQSATSKRGRGGTRYRPYAFTEHGALMAANVLNSPRAVEASVLVVRAFVHLRQSALTHADLRQRLDELERQYDRRFKLAFDAIRSLMAPAAKPRRRIGFATATA